MVGEGAPLSDPDETWEERVFREDAERRAWLEDAINRVDAGLPGDNILPMLKRFAAYMRIQIAEDDIADAEFAAVEAGYGSDVLPARSTRRQDRAGLELALMLIAGES